MKNNLIEIKSSRIGEKYYKIEHSSGLTVLLCPREDMQTAYALFGTNYGSIDSVFKTQKDEDFVVVPDGIAHFLEHKLFENEDGDAFAKYAETGASANAYTSFDKTCYLFSCSDNFEKALDILLGFVSEPYFTDATVQKEQGIIGQEIQMYADNPGWRVFFNLLTALYKNNPVNKDILGTIESIAQIDKELLYSCYRTFYNLGNMVLSVAGKFDIQTVLDLCDKHLQKAEDVTIERKSFDEPEGVSSEYVHQKLTTAAPLFTIGLKLPNCGERGNFFNQVCDELLAEMIAGDATDFYRDMYDSGLINSTFSHEVMSGKNYQCLVFSGESEDPKKVREKIAARIAYLKENGLDKAVFEKIKKSVYGQYIAQFSRVESVASLMLAAHFAGTGLYDLMEHAAAVTFENLVERFGCYGQNNIALSVVSTNEI